MLIDRVRSVRDEKVRQLHKAVLSPTAQAPSIPNLWPELVERGISIRVGEVSMICGRPSTGKSMVALNIAYRAQVSTLYVSADSHMATQSIRLMSLMTNRPQNELESMLIDAKQEASDMLRSQSNIRWSFLSSPTADQILEMIEAHIEMWSEPPLLLIVDNLTDVLREEGDEWGKKFLLEMKYLAREYEMAVCILHHMSLSKSHAPDTVPPMEAIQGKTAETPALILSVTTSDNGWLGIGAIKNRYGSMNAHGEVVDWLPYDPATARVGPLVEAVA